jgi:hypothetical protein
VLLTEEGGVAKVEVSRSAWRGQHCANVCTKVVDVYVLETHYLLEFYALDKLKGCRKV